MGTGRVTVRADLAAAGNADWYRAVLVAAAAVAVGGGAPAAAIAAGAVLAATAGRRHRHVRVHDTCGDAVAVAVAAEHRARDAVAVLDPRAAAALDVIGDGIAAVLTSTDRRHADTIAAGIEVIADDLTVAAGGAGGDPVGVALDSADRLRALLP